MRSYRWRELERLLFRAGFERRETKSSHAFYRHPALQLTATLVMKHPGCEAAKSAVHEVLGLCEEVQRRRDDGV